MGVEAIVGEHTHRISLFEDLHNRFLSACFYGALNSVKELIATNGDRLNIHVRSNEALRHACQKQYFGLVAYLLDFADPAQHAAMTTVLCKAKCPNEATFCREMSFMYGVRFTSDSQRRIDADVARRFREECLELGRPARLIFLKRLEQLGIDRFDQNKYLKYRTFFEAVGLQMIETIEDFQQLYKQAQLHQSANITLSQTRL